MSTDNEICRMDAVTVAARVKDKTLSAIEVTEAVLRRMDKLEPVPCFKILNGTPQTRFTAWRRKEN